MLELEELEEPGRQTDWAEMDQVSCFRLRRREREKEEEKWVKISFCASLTWQTGAFCRGMIAGHDGMIIMRHMKSH